MSADLVAFLRARLDDDEAWARAASRVYRFADEGSVPPADGVHWTWVTGENWEPVRPDPAIMELVEGADGSWDANLATVEQWPTSVSGEDGVVIRTSMMPCVYANSINEMDPAAAGHIVRHDPARVLADIDSKRRILDWLDAVERYMDRDDMSWHQLGGAIDVDHVRVLLAAPYRGHPDWRTEWNA